MQKNARTRRATLADVALAAGVGAITVSRTINGHPYVSEETAKKVRAAINQLGYRPNQAARMLTGQLSRSLGLIVPDLADPFFSVVAHAVQETARENGYLVWLAASSGDTAIEAAQVEQMTHHPVDGILLVPVDSRHNYLKLLLLDQLFSSPSTAPLRSRRRTRWASRTGPARAWPWNTSSPTDAKDCLRCDQHAPADHQRTARRL